MGSQHSHTLLASSLLAAFASVAQAWTPGTGHEADTSGFTVNTQSRTDVISFWHSVYRQSEGYEDRVNWTGSIVSGNPGTTSAAFKGDVERRINYYRAMAGMSANISVSNTSLAFTGGNGPSAPAGTTKQAAAQAAAFMLSCNSGQYRPGGGVATGAHNPHNPPSSWFCASQTARNGAFHSNLAVGHYGPGAIDAYIRENSPAGGGTENNDVGHRRWILYSRIQEMSTGDVIRTPSGNAPYFSANALYVSGNLLPPPASNTFVAWPNAGFFPQPILPERWSLSYPGADFSSASVTVTNSANSPVPTTVVSRTATYADNTLVWKLNTAPPSATTADQTYHITVSNILVGGSPRSHSYSITIINPDRLLETVTLRGSTSPPDTGADYFFSTVPQASAYRMQVSRKIHGTWAEGAEDATASNIEDGTSASYNLRTTTAAMAGAKGFHLGLTAANPALQYVRLDRQVIPASNSELKFHFRKRRMSPATRAKVEILAPGSETWTELWSLAGDGGWSNGFTAQAVPLSAYAGQIVQIRFSVGQETPGTLWPADDPSWGHFNGIHIDSIHITGDDMELSNPTETDYPPTATRATLDTTTAGNSPGRLLDTSATYILRLRAKIGSHWFPYAPPLEVTPVPAASLGTYQLWLRSRYPVIGGVEEDYDRDGIDNGLERVFGSNPMDSTDAASPLAAALTGDYLEISRTVIPGASVEAEYSHTLAPGSWHPATVTITGNTATAKAPAGPKGCYIRWKTAAP